MTLYQWIRTLSLDVVAGSLAGGALFAWLFAVGNAMPWSWWWILGLSVWIVYTSDHLLDARRLGPQSGTPRHRFHYRHFRALAFALFLAAALCLALIALALPALLILAGLCLGACALLHLLAAQLAGRIAYPAELVIAILYTAGIAFAPLLIAGVQLSGHGDVGSTNAADRFAFAALETALRSAYASVPAFVWHSTALFFLAAFGNLVAFSLFEAGIDRREAPGRLIAMLRIPGARVVLLTIATLSVMIAATAIHDILALPIDAAPLAVFTIAVLLLACLLPPIVYAARNLRDGYLTQHERYRALCDGVFLLYLLPPLLAWLTR